VSGAWSNDQLNSLFIYDVNGNLILTVTETGIAYIAPSRRFDLDTTGLKIQAEPADGGYVQLTTDSSLGAVIFLQIANSAVPGVTFTQTGAVWVDENVFPGNESIPSLNLTSPAVNNLTRSSISLDGESSTSGTPSKVQISTDEVYSIALQNYNNGRAIGSGWFTGAQATGNFGPIGNAETIFLAAPSEIYLATHAYEVVVWGQATVSVAPNRPVWRIRQSSDGTANLGTQCVVCAKPHVNTGMHDASFTGVFGVGASNVTTFIILTMTSASAAFTVTAQNSPFQFFIRDIGLAADHPGIALIT
jgi:hypothetical protein